MTLEKLLRRKFVLFRHSFIDSVGKVSWNLTPNPITGTLSVSKWCEAMEAATTLGLPWRLLRDKLAPMADTTQGNPNEVNYRKTLEMLDTDLIVS